MLNRDFRELISAFNDARVEFLVVGGYALAAHGLPRATGDLDLWLRPDAANADRVWVALAAFGAPLSALSRQDFVTPDIVVQFGVEPTRVDIMSAIEAVSFDDAYAKRVIVDVDGLSLPVIARADLLRNKRAVGRPQDLADAARLDTDQH